VAEHMQPPVPAPHVSYAWGPPAYRPLEHPLDPEPVTSTKASAALVLSILALLLTLCGGGWVPGLAALVLIPPAREEITASAGYLTGSGALRAAKVMSWIAVGLSAVLVVGLAVWWLLGWGTADPLPDYGDTVN
jgi:hydroxylaminobenzene mutase